MASPNYAIPPWLQPKSNPGEEYITAYRAGSAIAAEKAQLAQRAEEAGMQAQIRQQQLAQESRENAQRIEVESAYRSQQIGLRKQALDQAQQKIEAQAASAARRFAAQEAIKADIAAGVPHAAAFLKHPEAYSSMSGVAGLAAMEQERAQPFVPKGFIEPVTKTPLVQVSRGGHYIKGEGETVTPEAEPLRIKGTTNTVPGAYTAGNKIVKAGTSAGTVEDDVLKSQIKELRDSLKSMSESVKNDVPRIAAAHREISNLEKQRISLARGGATPSPAPSKERVKVKSPDGKVGTIPADQVDEAAKAGYSIVK